ncbi:MAG TPA: hypothetical protein VEM40_03025 [Nitrospirota bacterium]|nr:hypothetical protein [Nitrospirota bacterium]
MRVLIWAVFLAGAFASQYFTGSEGRIAYLIAVLVVITLFRRPLVIGLTRVASKLGFMKETIEQMPMSITLVKAAASDEAAKPVAAALSAAGFVDAGAWDISGMPKIKLALMIHPAENFLAAIETASAIGAQLNVHTLYSNGSTATFTNSKLPAPPNAQRCGVTSVRMPGASPKAVLSRARAERTRDGINAMTAEEAPRAYERLYAESIRYRKMQGA